MLYNLNTKNISFLEIFKFNFIEVLYYIIYVNI